MVTTEYVFEKAKSDLECNKPKELASFEQTWSSDATIFLEDNDWSIQAFTTKVVKIIRGNDFKVAVYLVDTYYDNMASLAYIIEHPNGAFYEDVKKASMEFAIKAKDKYENK